MSAKDIGPELPPGLRRPAAPEEESCADDDTPEKPAIGPVLPPHLRKRAGSPQKAEPSTSSSNIRKPSTIGPALPPHLQQLAAREEEESQSSSSDSKSSDEDEQIGPSLTLQGGQYDMKKEFAERERRAEASKETVLERESWMTELPSDRTGVKIGLGARMFTKREGTETVLDDSWTATPNQEKQKPKKDKKAEQHMLESAQRKRDAEIDEQLTEFNAAKRSKPLIEMHKDKEERRAKKKEKKDKKQKKKKDKKSKKKKNKKSKDSSDDEVPSTARKPFNWEEDMKVSMVDTTRAKSMLDKTLLQSRFASSKSQKYL